MMSMLAIENWPSLLMANRFSVSAKNSESNFKTKDASRSVIGSYTAVDRFEDDRPMYDKMVAGESCNAKCDHNATVEILYSNLAACLKVIETNAAAIRLRNSSTVYVARAA
jgi:hypothetical protein